MDIRRTSFSAFSVILSGFLTLFGPALGAQGLPSSTALTASPNPATYGQTVTLTATVTGTVTPTGTVTFMENGQALPGGANVSGTSGTYVYQTPSGTSLPTGTHYVSAQYSGDSQLAASSGTPATPLVVNVAAATTALTGGGTSAYGQAVTFTATVTAKVAGTFTGSVEFLDGANILATVPVSGGSVSLTIPGAQVSAPLILGKHTITANYTGDAAPASFGASPASPAITETVNQATTTTQPVTTSAAAPVYGQPVTFKTTVITSTNVPPPDGGVVTFYDNGSQIGTGILASASASYTTATLSVASHSITAKYGGDIYNAASTAQSSPALAVTVGQAGTSVATALASGPNPSYFGQSVTFSATVTAVAPSAGVPTGTVTFYDGAIALGTATLSNGVATFTTSTLAPGANSGGTVSPQAHLITATYSGVTNFATSNNTSAPFTQTVGPAPDTMVLTASTSAPVYGQAVTLTASGLPSSITNTSTSPETVAFYDGSTFLGTSPVSSGRATLATVTGTNALAAGSHSLTAQYSGDANHDTFTTQVLVLVVAPATPGISLAALPTSPSLNQPTAFTATLTGAGEAPTGTVTFSTGTNPLGSGTLAAGIASATAPLTTLGSNVITATYVPGDPNYAAVTKTLTLSVGQDTTSVVVTSSASPQNYGNAQPVVLTASVTLNNPGSGGLAPTGTVTFTDAYTATGGTTATTSTLASGVTASQTGNPATYLQSSATLKAGTHVITATYNGDTDGSKSSSTFTQNIGQDGTSIQIAPGSGITSNAGTYTAAFSKSASFVASVTSSPVSALPATGTVTFTDTSTTPSTTLGTATLTSAGTATLTLNNLLLGSHTVTAAYSGDNNFTTSTTGTALSLNVAAPSTTTLVSSQNPSNTLATVTFTAAVGTTANTTPTGSVSFTDTSTTPNTTLGTATVSQGQASLAVPNLAAGTHTITATFTSTDPSIAPSSTQSPYKQTVDQVTNFFALGFTSAPPFLYGQPVTLTATVGDLPAAAGTPTGNVTFLDGTASLGSAPLVGGTATLTTSTLAPTNVTAHSITATYAGSGLFLATTSVSASPALTPLTPTVNPNTPTVTLTSPSTAISFNQPVTFTATVAAPSNTVGAAVPTGSVTFTAQNTNPITSAVTTTTLGSASLSAGVASFTTSALAGGADSVTANYNGNADYTVNTSSPFAVSVGTDLPTLALSANNAPSVTGQSVTFTATLAPVAPVTRIPTGSVTFSVDGATPGVTVTVSGGKANYSVALLAGAHSVTATYSGDPDFGTTSASLSQTVNKGATATVLSPSANAASYGQPVTFTATVSAVAPAAGSPTLPTGSVTFFANGVSLGTSPFQSGKTTATFQTATLPQGSNAITASYAGDSNFAASPVSAEIFQTVVMSNSTVTLTASSPSPVAYNLPLTLTATVAAAAPSTGTPTGSVTFSDGATALGSAVPLSGGVASYTPAQPFAPGSHSFTAAYSGDTNYNSVTSKALSESISLDPTSTVLTTSGPSPSGLGQNLSFTANVTANTGGAVPTGSVEFLDGSTLVDTEPLSPVAGSTPTAAGTFQTASLKLGNHSITAKFVATATAQASTSNALAQVVANLQTSGTSLGASSTSPAYGQPVTLTATVTPAPAALTGSEQVIFYANSVELGTGTVTLAGTPAVATATFVAGGAGNPPLGIGLNALTATYGGDATLAGSNSNASPVTVTVGKETTSTALAASTASPGLNQPVVFTATVTPSYASPAAYGTVTFMDGGTPLGTATLTPVAGSGTSTASFTTSTLAAGPHTVVANYPGDAIRMLQSSSTGVPVTVTSTIPTTTTLSPNSTSVAYSQPFTLTAAVTPSTATGSVTFTLVGSSGNQVVSAPQTVLSGGTASFTPDSTDFPPPDTYSTCTAAYTPDSKSSNLSASSSSPVTVAVAQAADTVRLSILGTSLGGALGSVTLNQPVNLTALVIDTSTNATLAPTGTVTFYVNSQAVGTATLAASMALGGGGTTTAGTQAIHALASAGGGGLSSGPSSSAQYAYTPTALGSITISAIYTAAAPNVIGGETDFTSPTTSSSTLSETVIPPASSTSLTEASSNPVSDPNQPVTLNVAVTGATQTVPATGTITLTDSNGSTLATLNLTAGAASFTSSTLAPGSHVITAQYSGDSNYAPSTSASLALSVELSVGGTISYTSSTGVTSGIVYLTLQSNPTPPALPVTVGSTAVPWSAGSSPSYQIPGVAPGQYTLTARMAIQPSGGLNDWDPTYSSSAAFTVSTASAVIPVTLVDPSFLPTTPSTPLPIQVSTFFPNGVLVSFQPWLDQAGVQQAQSYTLQWWAPTSGTPTYFSHTFPAVGDNHLLLTGSDDSNLGQFQNYLFTVLANAGGMSYPIYSTYPDPTANPGGLLLGSPSGGVDVSTTLTYGDPAAGPTYVAYGDDINGYGVAFLPASTPPATSQVSFTVGNAPANPVNVIALVDQNDTGSSVNPGWAGVLAPDDGWFFGSGSLTNVVLPTRALYTSGSTSQTQVQGPGPTYSPVTSAIQFNLNNQVKNIIAVTLQPGLNLPGATAQANPYGGHSFAPSFALGSPSALPSAATAQVAYSDGSSDSTTLTTSTFVNAFPTTLAVSAASGATTPTFSWDQVPSGTPPATYFYEFMITDNNGFTWTVPYLTSPNGSSIINNGVIGSIQFGPVNGATSPSIPNLVPGTLYTWGVAVQDPSGNLGWTTSTYQVPVQPTVSISPASPQTITGSQSVTFTATVTGNPATITWQYSSDGVVYQTLEIDTIPPSSTLSYTFSPQALNIGLQQLYFQAVIPSGQGIGSIISNVVNINYTAGSSGGGQPVATSTTLSSSAMTSFFGQSVTFTATVTPNTATGTITFMDGTTTLGSGAVAGGVATFSTSSLAVGAHSITAAYGGDSNDLASSSTSLAQQVNPATGASGVTGTLSYTPANGGTETGVVYVGLLPMGSNAPLSQSAAVIYSGSTVSYTIVGVPPGQYGLYAEMAIQPSGGFNAADPAVASLVPVTVTGGLVTQAVTLVDPPNLFYQNPVLPLPTPAANTSSASDASPSFPQPFWVFPMAGGVLITHQPLDDAIGLPTADSYLVQWTDTATNAVQSRTFPAVNDNRFYIYDPVNLQDGHSYMFNLYAQYQGAQAAYSSFGPVTIAAPSGGASIHVEVTVPGSELPSGPLYLFEGDDSLGYAGVTAVTPVATSQTVTLAGIPSGGNTFGPVTAVLEQNAGGPNSNPAWAGTLAPDDEWIINSNADITGGSTVQLTLPSNITLGLLNLIQNQGDPALPAQQMQITAFNQSKNVISATLSPGSAGAVSLANPPGANALVATAPLATFPASGTSYPVNVFYSDGSHDSLNLTTATPLNAFATSLAATNTTCNSTTPTFTWVAPAGLTTPFYYVLAITDNNGFQELSYGVGGGGYGPSTTQWDYDPNLDQTLTPLTPGVTYYWGVGVVDSNTGNQAWQYAAYTPQASAPTIQVSATGAVLTATFCGSPTPTLQWYLSATGTGTPGDNSGSWAAIGGATGATYTVPPGTTGYIEAVASNGPSPANTAVSNSINLQTLTGLGLTASINPPGTLTVGTPVTLGLTVNGASSPIASYQWLEDGSPVGIGPTYTFTPAYTDNGANISCIVTPSTGSPATASITLNVQFAPVITSLPGWTDSNYPNGPSSFTLTPTILANPAPTHYQWYFNGSPITGATGSSYGLSGASYGPQDNGGYYVVVSNGIGTPTQSSTAQVTIGVPLQISGILAQVGTAPATAGNFPGLTTAIDTGSGEAVSFTVNATGPTTLSYQWQVSYDPNFGTGNIVLPPNGTSAKYSFNAVWSPTQGSNDDGLYVRVVVSDTSGTAPITSPATEMQVFASPRFTANLSTVPNFYSQTTAAPYSAFQLTVAAIGNPMPSSASYTYYKDGLVVGTGPTYSVSNPTQGDTGTYEAIVSNSYGQATSNTAQVAFGTALSGQLVATQAGNPSLAGVPLYLDGAATNPATLANAAGYFNFTNLTAGSAHTVSVAGPPASATSVQATPAQVPNFPITLQAGYNALPASFQVALGYGVQGTASYGSSSSYASTQALGSFFWLTAPGSVLPLYGNFSPYNTSSTYSINMAGVAPGNYTLNGELVLGPSGGYSANNPTFQTTVTVANSNVTLPAATFADPGTPPNLNGNTILWSIAGYLSPVTFDLSDDPLYSGLVINYLPLATNGGDSATSYTLSWTDENGIPRSKPFLPDPAHLLFLGPGTPGAPFGQRSLGSMQLVASNAGSQSTVSGPTYLAPIPDTSASGTSIQEGLDYDGQIPNSGSHLYLGVIDEGTPPITPVVSGVTPVYAVQATPSGNSTDTFTLPNLPDAIDHYYLPFAFLDQDGNGVNNPGDVSTLNQGTYFIGPPSIRIFNISGGASTSLTLPNSHGNLLVNTTIANLQPAHYPPNYTGSAPAIFVNFTIANQVKLITGARLISGPYFPVPMDLPPGLGSHQYTCALYLATAPSIGDTFTLLAEYSDGSSEQLSGSVPGDTFVGGPVMSQQEIPVLQGTNGTSLPGFFWQAPSNPPPDFSDYTYLFQIGTASGLPVLDVDSGYASNGIPSSQTSLSWFSDPTSENLSPFPSLTLGTLYIWGVSLRDPAGNLAIQEGTFSY